MDLKPGFAFNPQPPIGLAPPHTSAPPATGGIPAPMPHPPAPTPPPAPSVLPATGPLGPLQDLLGTWSGTGFNVIWRPNHAPGQDHFLELNRTQETIEFVAIPGAIPNRGLLQPDINMFGIRYLQQIQDANTNAGLHIEPGIWANVPPTTDPAEAATVVRMASIPHGTTIIAQGVAGDHAGTPVIPPVSITPFPIGAPNTPIQFPESHLATPSVFRSPNLAGITQAMVDDPNSVLRAALSGGPAVVKNTSLVVSSGPSPVLGGGVANTAFLQGGPHGPNAVAAIVSATFWIETIKGPPGHPDTLQLQYTQTVLLNFATLSWPHVTVATLRKQAPGTPVA